MHASIERARQRTRVWRDAARPRPVEGVLPTTINASGRKNMIDQNTLKNIEDLHRLKNDGIITEDEFERSKQKLLFDTRATPAPSAPGGPVPRRPTVTDGAVARLFGPVPATLPASNDLTGWVMLPLRRYAEFTGRSTRKEFWMFQLLYAALFFVGYVAIMQGGDVDASAATVSVGRTIFFFVCLALLGMIVPLLAVQARRFRDINQSPWLVLLNLVPYVGVVVVYLVMLTPGTVGDNRSGPDPLAS